MHKTRAQRQPVNNSHLSDTTTVTDLMSGLCISVVFTVTWQDHSKFIKKKFRMP